MFDIGFWELTLIAVVALLVVGPERLPRMAREVGIWVGRIRRYVQHVKDDIETEIRNEGLKEMVQQPSSLHDFSDLANETRESLEQARDEMEGARREAGEPATESDSLDEADTGEPRQTAMFDEADTGESRETAMFEEAAPPPADPPDGEPTPGAEEPEVATDGDHERER